MAALAFEIEDGVDHVLEHARAGDLSVLGDVADEDDGGAGLLGEARQLLRAGADLGDGAGRGFETVGPERLHAVDDDEFGRGLLQRLEDGAEVGLGGELDRRFGDAEAARAALDLRDGFLAGDVDRLDAGLRHGRSRLQEQGGLADAGIAADQHG